LPRFLDQGLGRVEEAKGSVSTQDTELSELRNERTAVIAEVRRQIAEWEEAADLESAESSAMTDHDAPPSNKASAARDRLHLPYLLRRQVGE
jgi:hypothetical protein